MNLINKKHPEILENKSGKNDSYMSVTDVGLYFTSASAKTFGLTAGMYLQFLNDGREWSFFQNGDADGFLLTADAKESSSAVAIHNKALVKLFTKSTGFGKGTRLLLIESNIKHQGAPCVEIITNKSFDQLMKAI